jgi:hypothetical protein
MSAATALRPKQDVIMPIAWVIILTAVVALPYLTGSPTLDDDLTRYTVRLALGYYAAAVTLMLLLEPPEWLAAGGRGRLARWCWTLGWLTYLVHLFMAFHHVHHWSHGAAVHHTQELSGFGPGIWFSHLFTLLWTADVLFWWLRPASYATRPPWVDWIVHGFMAFIVFNATVVFETGFIRWAGIALFTELGLIFLYRLRRLSLPARSTPPVQKA